MSPISPPPRPHCFVCYRRHAERHRCSRRIDDPASGAPQVEVRLIPSLCSVRPPPVSHPPSPLSRCTGIHMMPSLTLLSSTCRIKFWPFYKMAKSMIQKRTMAVHRPPSFQLCPCYVVCPWCRVPAVVISTAPRARSRIARRVVRPPHHVPGAASRSSRMASMSSATVSSTLSTHEKKLITHGTARE